MEERDMQAVRPFLLGAARIERAEAERDEWEDEDSFGNPGRTCVEQATAVALSDLPGEEVSRLYREAGFSELPRDSHREDDRVRFQRILTDVANPFVLEHVVQVGVRWRELLPAHRSAFKAKLEALREEAKKRASAMEMLREMEAGLLTRLELESSRRLFRMEPVFGNGARMGSLVPLGVMDQLVYTVVPRERADEEGEDAGEPMYLTILGTDDRRVSFLFSGGIVGQRTITDLDAGVAHNAWFQNRQSVLTEDTAPWVSRRLYQDLVLEGEGAMIVRWGRDDGPISVVRKGEEALPIKTAEGERTVPVLVAETSKEDRLWILMDEESPLVIRMEEAGAELLRSVEEIRRIDDL